MRELKFRAWDTEAKCYIKDPILVDNFGNVYVVCEEASNKREACIITGKPNAIIEQYTGLKDKNGKEIYEGDIVEVCAMKMSGQILYGDEHCAYRIVGIGEEALNINLGDFDWHMLEILGNIHENPELLEEAE